MDPRSRPYDWLGYVIHAVFGAVIGGGAGFLSAIRYSRYAWRSGAGVTGDLLVLWMLVPAVIVGTWAGYLRDRYWFGDDGVRERYERRQNIYPAHVIALATTFITLAVVLWKFAPVALNWEQLPAQGPSRLVAWSTTVLTGIGAAWAGWTLWRVRRSHHDEMQQQGDRAT